jgi:hypothetical protein
LFNWALQFWQYGCFGAKIIPQEIIRGSLVPGVNRQHSVALPGGIALPPTAVSFFISRLLDLQEIALS